MGFLYFDAKEVHFAFRKICNNDVIQNLLINDINSLGR